MDVYKTHGAFSWCKLMTTDPAAAAVLYGKLFGWTVNAMGAKVCMEPMDLPTVGRMAAFVDPQGAMRSIIQYSAS